jgi:hypothetical protein
MMAEDEAAEENLIAAINRVHKMPWPSIRRKALTNAMKMTTHALGYEIVFPDQQPPAACPSAVTTPEPPRG